MGQSGRFRIAEMNCSQHIKWTKPCIFYHEYSAMNFLWKPSNNSRKVSNSSTGGRIVILKKKNKRNLRKHLNLLYIFLKSFLNNVMLCGVFE